MEDRSGVKDLLLGGIPLPCRVDEIADAPRDKMRVSNEPLACKNCEKRCLGPKVHHSVKSCAISSVPFFARWTRKLGMMMTIKA
jgi:hypothetical protein